MEGKFISQCFYSRTRHYPESRYAFISLLSSYSLKAVGHENGLDHYSLLPAPFSCCSKQRYDSK